MRGLSWQASPAAPVPTPQHTKQPPYSSHLSPPSSLLLTSFDRGCQLHNRCEDLKGKIRVYVRVRPFSSKERDRGCKEVVQTQGKQSISVQDPKAKGDKTFEFDQVQASLVSVHTNEMEEQGQSCIPIFIVPRV